MNIIDSFLHPKIVLLTLSDTSATAPPPDYNRYPAANSGSGSFHTPPPPYYAANNNNRGGFGGGTQDGGGHCLSCHCHSMSYGTHQPPPPSNGFFKGCGVPPQHPPPGHAANGVNGGCGGFQPMPPVGGRGPHLPGR